MSSPDSEGKCQCQHCDGKQSARECLCDSVGVTSTMDESEFHLGNKKSGNFLTIQTALSGVEAVGWHAAGWWHFSITTPQDNFDVERKKENKAQTTRICQRISMNGLTQSRKTKPTKG